MRASWINKNWKCQKGIYILKVNLLFLHNIRKVRSSNGNIHIPKTVLIVRKIPLRNKDFNYSALFVFESLPWPSRDHRVTVTLHKRDKFFKILILKFLRILIFDSKYQYSDNLNLYYRQNSNFYDKKKYLFFIFITE